MPLVRGHSHVKWHLPHSIHSEHRGRTPKCPIANHRVEYGYGRLVPVRIGIDKAGSLSECPIEFEVIQEFPLPGASAGGGGGGGGGVGPTRDEKITLGRLTLNLAEYVEESEAVLRDTGYRARGPSSTAAGAGASGSATAAASAKAVAAAATAGHGRKRSSLSTHTPADATSSPKSTSTPDSRNSLSKDAPPPSSSKTPSINEPTAPGAAVPSEPEAQPVEDGIVRRYLMTDSKINSTLKVGILMVQLDGERNFVAPPLKTAAVFGGIAGMASSAGAAGSSSGPRHLTVEDLGQHFQDPSDLAAQFPSASLSGGGAGSGSAGRDVHELHDMYRRTLAASWACQPGELPADECIEDIFQGGDGFDPDGGADADGLGLGLGLGHGGGGDVTPRGPGVRGYGGGAAGMMGGGVGGGGGGSPPLRRGVVRREDSGSSSATGEAGGDFLRPGPPPPPSPRRASASGPGGRRYHGRHGSGDSTNTLRHDGGGMGAGAHWGGGGGHQQHQQHHHGRTGHRRDSSKDSASPGGGGMTGLRSRSGSLASLAGTIEMERSRSGFKSAREVREWEVRDDLVAWKLPGTAS